MTPYADYEPPAADGAPDVSVIVANFNSGPFVEMALRTVLRQTLRNIEVIVADDASTDDSPSQIAAIADVDHRVRLLRGTVNAGPAAARNRCLDVARGQWLAVFDSDDLMHCRRLETLMALARRDGADVVADDILIFDDDGRGTVSTCLRGAYARTAHWVDLPSYIRGNAMFGRAPSLGYLKPLISREFLSRAGVRYDPSLRIGEDYDFIARLLAHGARFRIYPALTYFYRKHGHSVSHRLSAETLAAMRLANVAFNREFTPSLPSLAKPLAERSAMLDRAEAFDDLVRAVKRHDLSAAFRITLANPGATLLLRLPVVARVGRALRRERTAKPPSAVPSLCVISRQRVVGPTNGSSAYLLAICGALSAAGWDVHLLIPSPTVFGRQPVLFLRGEMNVFRSIAIRKAFRVGRVVVASDARCWGLALRGALGAMLSGVGVGVEALSRPAGYAIAAPWQRADLLFLAQHGRARTDAALVDYAFLADGLPYLLSPAAPSAVLMHDLFSSRLPQFERLGATDTVAATDLATELDLLGRADAVIAIQHDEADVVRHCLPTTKVLVAPISVAVAQMPAVGSDTTVLFVGSRTAPNTLGMRWFIDAIWPDVCRQVPGATLLVAGGVGATLGQPPASVRLLGVVPDLEDLYYGAGVVISPLQAGSGLKVKLVEALGRGKAIVATPHTLQGVPPCVRTAVAMADTAMDFAAGVVAFLRDPALRHRFGASALAAARAHFSAPACHAELLSLFEPAARGAARVQYAATDR
jgi:GT2 family glycosyltransferase/glycosyltransferase involved in cell wall biosynthesis